MPKKLVHEEVKAARPALEELAGVERFPVSIYAENIRSLYNVGSIFRTADGALAEKLWLCGYTGYPPRKEIDKTALGSALSVPWEHSEDGIPVLSGLKEKGVQLVALEHTDSSVKYTEADYNFPLCVMLGNEVEGLSDQAVSMCDIAVEIPMYGLKQSLNVSVACGVMLYFLVEEFLKRKNHGK
jgi:tRNA G18 (ribose-2'-O)-methylase SpoU